MTNQELKAYAKKRKVFQYQIAEALEMQESAFSKMFRKEINEDRKKEIIIIIDELYYQKHPEKRPKKKQKSQSNNNQVMDNTLFDDLLKGL